MTVHDGRQTVARPPGPVADEYRPTGRHYMEAEFPGTFDRISSPWRDRVHWGPIVAGMATAITSLLLLGLLGAAIGLTTINAGTATIQGGPPPDLGRNAAMWSTVSAIISFFLGGYVAARTTATFNRGWGALNGALVFMMGVPVMLWLASQGLGAVLGGLGAFADELANQAQNTPQPTPVEVARTAAQIRDAAWTTLIGALLSLFAATIGGFAGTRKDVEVETLAGRSYE